MSVQSLDIISVNLWQILISLANLLIIYLILKKVLFAKVQGVLNTRQHQVTEMYDAADQSRTDAESMKQEYEEKLAGARDEADKIVRNATQTAQRRGDQIVQEASSQASHLKQKAEEEIAQEKRRMLTDVRGEISDLAVSIASKVVEREIRKEDQDTFVDEFIKNVGPAVTEQSREYGEGLYALCAEEALSGDVLEELDVLNGSFKAQPDYLRLLSNMSLGREERLGILDRTLRGQVHPYVLNFCKILLEKGLLHEFSDCVKAYRARYLQDNGIVEASVTTAVPLDDGQRKKLMEKLSAMTGKQIVLKERLDPAVLGGVRLEMDGKRYDNTVQSRLTAIHRAIGGQA